jgi:hypothetical protein
VLWVDTDDVSEEHAASVFRAQVYKQKFPSCDKKIMVAVKRHNSTSLLKTIVYPWKGPFFSLSHFPPVMTNQ